jgi:hypothetical protein
VPGFTLYIHVHVYTYIVQVQGIKPLLVRSSLHHYNDPCTLCQLYNYYLLEVHDIRSATVVCLQIGEGGNGDREFEDRFLQCFGLVDPVVPTGPTRTASETTAEEREQTLKRQSQTSPW